MNAKSPPAQPSSGYVLAIGAANMDITASTDHVLLARDSTPGRIRCAPGGVARNVAENLARLGLDVRLCSVLGDDPYGAIVLEHTRQAGVDVQGCEMLRGHATSSYLSLHGPDGDMALALNDMEILDQLTPARLQAGGADTWQAAVLLLDCNLPQSTLDWLCAHAAQTPLFVEAVSAFKCRRVLPWLAQVHTLKANRIEAQALTGRSLDSDAELVEAARWLHGRGVRQVVLSLGERGLFWSDAADGHGWQPAIEVAVCNASGAGDAVMAGLLYGFLQSMPLREAVGFAAGCAALTLGAPSANHPGLGVARVRQLLAQGACPKPPSTVAGATGALPGCTGGPTVR